MSAEPIRLVDVPDTEADERFCVLYRRYHPRVRGLAARRFPAFDADDVAQETMVRVLLHAHRLDPQRDPWPYIAAIAVNVARDFGRARVPEVALTEEAYDREVAPAADEPMLRAERSANVQKVLDDLAPGSRQVLALQAYEDMSVGEIAKFLGTNDNAVRQKLFRARHQFRRAVAGVPSGSFGIAALVVAFRRRIAAAATPAGGAVSVAGAAVVAVAVTGVVTFGGSPWNGSTKAGAPRAAAPVDDAATRAGTEASPETPDIGRGATARNGVGAAPGRAVPPRTATPYDAPPAAQPRVRVDKPGDPFKPGQTDRTEVVVPTPFGDVVVRTSGENGPGESVVCSVARVDRVCG